jgi:hypothetical protein
VDSAFGLVTFFFLFPESKVEKSIGPQQPTTPAQKDAAESITPTTPTSSPVTSQSPQEPATVFAVDFLSLLDTGNYAKAYYSLSENLKNQTDQIGFVQGMKQNRDWRGKLVQRKVFNMNMVQNPLGSPPGQYSQIIYQSNFEKALELPRNLALVLTADNTWKVFQCYIWPPSDANLKRRSPSHSVPPITVISVEGNFDFLS